jgi:fluoroacetyl-CoA thioesterase
MKPTLKAGLTHRFSYRVPENKTVPFLFPEVADFQSMPKVFATGFMVGLFEWACMQLLAPHLEPGEGSLGVHIDVSHEAATPPGLTITIDVECTAIHGNRVTFEVRAHDGIDLIGRGRHQRFVVAWDKFEDRVADKTKQMAKA